MQLDAAAAAAFPAAARDTPAAAHAACLTPHPKQDAAAAPESGSERPAEQGDVRARTTGPLSHSTVSRCGTFALHVHCVELRLTLAA